MLLEETFDLQDAMRAAPRGPFSLLTTREELARMFYEMHWLMTGRQPDWHVDEQGVHSLKGIDPDYLPGILGQRDLLSMQPFMVFREGGGAPAIWSGQLPHDPFRDRTDPLRSAGQYR